jgi:hypothetical protein
VLPVGSVGPAGDLDLIGRCKGGVQVVGRDFAMERLPLADGRTIVYKQVRRCVDIGVHAWAQVNMGPVPASSSSPP